MRVAAIVSLLLLVLVVSILVEELRRRVHAMGRLRAEAHRAGRVVADRVAEPFANGAEEEDREQVYHLSVASYEVIRPDEVLYTLPKNMTVAALATHLDALNAGTIGSDVARLVEYNPTLEGSSQTVVPRGTTVVVPYTFTPLPDDTEDDVRAAMALRGVDPGDVRWSDGDGSRTLYPKFRPRARVVYRVQHGTPPSGEPQMYDTPPEPPTVRPVDLRLFRERMILRYVGTEEVDWNQVFVFGRSITRRFSARTHAGVVLAAPAQLETFKGLLQERVQRLAAVDTQELNNAYRKQLEDFKGGVEGMVNAMPDAGVLVSYDADIVRAVQLIQELRAATNGGPTARILFRERPAPSCVIRIVVETKMESDTLPGGLVRLKDIAARSSFVVATRPIKNVRNQTATTTVTITVDVVRASSANVEEMAFQGLESVGGDPLSLRRQIANIAAAVQPPPSFQIVNIRNRDKLDEIRVLDGGPGLPVPPAVRGYQDIRLGVLSDRGGTATVYQDHFHLGLACSGRSAGLPVSYLNTQAERANVPWTAYVALYYGHWLEVRQKAYVSPFATIGIRTNSMRLDKGSGSVAPFVCWTATTTTSATASASSVEQQGEVDKRKLDAIKMQIGADTYNQLVKLRETLRKQRESAEGKNRGAAGAATGAVTTRGTTYLQRRMVRMLYNALGRGQAAINVENLVAADTPPTRFSTPTPPPLDGCDSTQFFTAVRHSNPSVVEPLRQVRDEVIKRIYADAPVTDDPMGVTHRQEDTVAAGCYEYESMVRRTCASQLARLERLRRASPLARLCVGYGAPAWKMATNDLLARCTEGALISGDSDASRLLDSAAKATKKLHGCDAACALVRMILLDADVAREVRSESDAEATKQRVHSMVALAGQHDMAGVWGNGAQMFGLDYRPAEFDHVAILSDRTAPGTGGAARVTVVDQDASVLGCQLGNLLDCGWKYYFYASEAGETSAETNSVPVFQQSLVDMTVLGPAVRELADEQRTVQSFVNQTLVQYYLDESRLAPPSAQEVNGDEYTLWRMTCREFQRMAQRMQLLRRADDPLVTPCDTVIGDAARNARLVLPEAHVPCHYDLFQRASPSCDWPDVTSLVITSNKRSYSGMAGTRWNTLLSGVDVALLRPSFGTTLHVSLDQAAVATTGAGMPYASAKRVQLRIPNLSSARGAAERRSPPSSLSTSPVAVECVLARLQQYCGRFRRKIDRTPLDVPREVCQKATPASLVREKLPSTANAAGCYPYDPTQQEDASVRGLHRVLAYRSTNLGEQAVRPQRFSQGTPAFRHCAFALNDLMNRRNALLVSVHTLAHAPSSSNVGTAGTAGTAMAGANMGGARLTDKQYSHGVFDNKLPLALLHRSARGILTSFHDPYAHVDSSTAAKGDVHVQQYCAMERLLLAYDLCSWEHQQPACVANHVGGSDALAAGIARIEAGANDKTFVLRFAGIGSQATALGPPGPLRYEHTRDTANVEDGFKYVLDAKDLDAKVKPHVFGHYYAEMLASFRYDPMTFELRWANGTKWLQLPPPTDDGEAAGETPADDASQRAAAEQILLNAFPEDDRYKLRVASHSATREGGLTLKYSNGEVVQLEASMQELTLKKTSLHEAVRAVVEDGVVTSVSVLQPKEGVATGMLGALADGVGDALNTNNNKNVGPLSVIGAFTATMGVRMPDSGYASRGVCAANVYQMNPSVAVSFPALSTMGLRRRTHATSVATTTGCHWTTPAVNKSAPPISAQEVDTALRGAFD